MPQIFIKPVKLVIWFILPFIFNTDFSPFEVKDDASLVAGRYKLRTSGNQQILLEGTVVFSTSVAISSKGKPCSTIKLDLENNGNEKLHSMGFLISKQNQKNELQQGKYKVPVKINGFIKDFEGVFGFANIKEMGELPFFAADGNIDISYIGPKLLSGNLTLKLENSEGKLLILEGDFSAIRKAIK